MKDDVEIVFDDRITALGEKTDGVAVSFEKGARRTFDLVFGCDGNHSAVRKLWFGHEAQQRRIIEEQFAGQGWRTAETGLETLVPRTEEAIRARNSQTGPAF